MAAILTSAEKLLVDYDLERLLFSEPGRGATGDFLIRERAKATPDYASLKAELLIEFGVVLDALYNVTAPTIAP